MSQRVLHLFFKNGKEVAILPSKSEELADFKEILKTYRFGSGGIFVFHDIHPDDTEVFIMLDALEFFVEKDKPKPQEDAE